MPAPPTATENDKDKNVIPSETVNDRDSNNDSTLLSLSEKPKGEEEKDDSKPVAPSANAKGEDSDAVMTSTPSPKADDNIPGPPPTIPNNDDNKIEEAKALASERDETSANEEKENEPMREPVAPPTNAEDKDKDLDKPPTIPSNDGGDIQEEKPASRMSNAPIAGEEKKDDSIPELVPPSSKVDDKSDGPPPTSAPNNAGNDIEGEKAPASESNEPSTNEENEKALMPKFKAEEEDEDDAAPPTASKKSDDKDTRMDMDIETKGPASKIQRKIEKVALGYETDSCESTEPLVPLKKRIRDGDHGGGPPKKKSRISST